MRTVEIFLNEILPVQQAAISRLACWNYESFEHVVIETDGFAWSLSEHKNMDLIAHYSTPRTNHRYTIGAIYNWKTKEYSFHS